MAKEKKTTKKKTPTIEEIEQKYLNIELWEFYEVQMNFNYRVCGSVPMSKEIVPIWLNSRKPKVKPDDAKPIEELIEEVNESIQEDMERTTLGFQQDDNGFFLRGGTFKAHMKDCANKIKELLGITAFRNKLAESVFVEDYKNYIVKNGEFVKESDGSYEQPVHAWVWTGNMPKQIHALKVIHFVEQPSIRIVLRVRRSQFINIGSLTKVFEYGSYQGYGGERSLGEGRYTFTIKKMGDRENLEEAA